MEFAFKNTVPLEFLGCKLCKAIYFRPDRKDLLENHLKLDHKIDFAESDFGEKTPTNCQPELKPVDNQPVIEPLPPVPVKLPVPNKNKTGPTPNNGESITKNNSPYNNNPNHSDSNLKSPIIPAENRKKKKNLKRRASASFRSNEADSSDSEEEKSRPERPRWSSKRPKKEPKIELSTQIKSLEKIDLKSTEQQVDYENSVVIPANDDSLDDTLTSEESGSESDENIDPTLTTMQLRRLFHKKYYKKCSNDKRVKMIIVKNKAWYECPVENCGKARAVTPLCVIEHYVAHHKNRKFKCLHDGCNTETSSVGKLVRHVERTRFHKDEKFILLPDGNKINKDAKGLMILAREIRKIAGVI